MNTQTKTRKSGKSFNRLPNQWYLKPKQQECTPLTIGIHETTTAAQAMTAIGYGDSHELKVRSLHYKVECEDYADLISCIKIIDSYNEFDADLIAKKAFWRLNLQHFLNDDNGNNGKSFFNFSVGRESSPCFYVSLNTRFHNKIIKDTEEMPATNDREAGTELFWEEYTANDFKENMTALASEIKADEFNIEEQTYFGDTLVLTARFWFD